MNNQNLIKLEGVDKVRMLPDFFSLSTYLKMTGSTKEQAKNFIFFAKKRGFISELGPKANIYFNILNDSKSKEKNLYKAYKLIYPDMIFAGTAQIRSADWMTQISQSNEIIVRRRDRYTQMYNAELMPRTKSWYKKYKKGIELQAGFYYLKPEYALVDLCEAKGYIPDPDDLYIDTKEERQKIFDTFNKLEVAIPEKLQELFEDCTLLIVKKKKVNL